MIDMSKIELNINKKLRVWILVSIAVATVIAGVIVVTQEMMARDLEETGRYHELIRKLFELDMLTGSYQVNPNTRAVRQWLSIYESYGSVFDKLAGHYRAEDLLLKELGRDYTELGELFSKLISLNAVDSFDSDEKTRVGEQLWGKLHLMANGTFELLNVNKNRILARRQIASVVVAFLLVAIILINAVIFYRAMAAVRKSARELSLANDLLEKRVVERTIELQKTNEMLSSEIVERKKAEDTLKEYAHRLKVSNDELQEFASVASHDLQEPLRKIQIFGGFLQERFKDAAGETAQDYLKRMISAAERMQSLLLDLLSYSRVTSRPAPFERVDLTKAAKEALDDLEAAVRRSRGVVSIGELPVVEADAHQIRRLFQNLIGNALKYSRPETPPEVSIVTLSQDAKVCRIGIKDNGIGFDTRYRDVIFKPFQRLHGKSQYNGTGMGLAICRKIVERHNGGITADSEAGQGSTFVVMLPLHHHEEK